MFLWVMTTLVFALLLRSLRYLTGFEGSWFPDPESSMYMLLVLIFVHCIAFVATQATNAVIVRFFRRPS